MKIVNLLVVHCSDSDAKGHDDIETIRNWHLLRGFRDVGYHYFIKNNGLIQVGRSLNEQGAHVRGYNKSSIGVCLSGRHHFSEHQIDALIKLINRLRETLFIQIENIKGHYELASSKTCPNFDIKVLRKMLIT